MRKLLSIVLLLLFLTPVHGESLKVEKIVENKDIKVGDDVRILLKFVNPFGKEVQIKIVDKNIFGNNGIDIQCMEYTLPPQKEVTLAYDPIKPYKPGNYTLDSAEITYTNPETGKVEKVNSNKVEIEVRGSSAQIEQQGITTIYQCNGVNMKTVSYSSSSSSFSINIGGSTITGGQTGIQNNQLNQNTNVIKKEIEKQKQMEKEFQENLIKNKEFQKLNDRLTGLGYNLTNASYNIKTNNTGSFELEYQKADGKIATVKGEMENGTLKNLMYLTAEDKEEILKKLYQNKQFQQYNRELVENGFNKSQPVFNQISQNHTKVEISYTKGREKAKIIADYVNGSIENIFIEKKSEGSNLLWFLLILPFLGLIGYISSRYFRNYFRNEKIGMSEVQVTKPMASVDFVQQAKDMLSDAERFHSEGRVKDAFEKISQAIRFYFSRKFNLNREITVKELLSTLRSTDFKEYSKIEECLELCNLVEFAKYSPDENDFRKALDLAREIIFNRSM